MKDAGLIKEVQGSTCVANLVLIKKANEKWRMCVDFTDLNKTYPEDHCTLLLINRLMDATAEHVIFFLVDAISGYHQIIMDEPCNDSETGSLPALGFRLT